MRSVSKNEQKKRGCFYCTDFKTVRRGVKMCKHDECPYHELDEFETYEDYFESYKGTLDELFIVEDTDDCY